MPYIALLWIPVMQRNLYGWDTITKCHTDVTNIGLMAIMSPVLSVTATLLSTGERWHHAHKVCAGRLSVGWRKQFLWNLVITYETPRTSRSWSSLRWLVFLGQSLYFTSLPWVISSFRCEVDENCALQGYYTASSGNCLPSFRNYISVSSSADTTRCVIT